MYRSSRHLIADTPLNQSGRVRPSVWPNYHDGDTGSQAQLIRELLGSAIGKHASAADRGLPMRIDVASTSLV